jgi:hypothetical protein
VLDQPKYLEAARRAADFLLQHHRRDDGTLLRTSRNGAAMYPGFLDDYAFMAQALLALKHPAAPQIASDMRRRFASDAGGFYFTEQSAQDLIIRQMIGSDSPLPSGNAVAAMVMLELNEPQIAREILVTFGGQLEASAEGMSSMVQAAGMYVQHHGAIEVAAAPRAVATGDVRPPTPQQIAAGVVLARGAWIDSQTLEIRLQVMYGFHINARQASSNLVPTELRAIQGGSTARVEYPPGELRQLAFADEPIRVYEGEVRLLVHLPSPRGSAGPLRLALTYQACDENACFPPVTKEIEVPLP